jgi:hypothetical protein
MSRQDKSQYRFFLFGKRKGRLDLYTNVAPIKAQIKDEYVISITAIPEIQVIASLRLLSNLSIKISRACATDSFNCGIEIASHRTAAAAARCNGTNSLRFPFFPCLRNECIHIQNNCNHCKDFYILIIIT